MKILRFTMLLLFSVAQFLYAAQRVSYNGLVYTVFESFNTAGVEWHTYGQYGDRLHGYYEKYNDTGYSGNITIPEKMEYMGKEYTVTELRDHCFENCKIDTITIPKTIKCIWSSAFKNAYVKCVNIQDVSSWCEMKIGSMPSLTSLYINGEPALDLVIPSDVKTIKSGTFSGFRNIKTVAISDSTKEIGSNAFYNCKSLISVTLPQNITKIAEFTFGCCDSLSQVQLPDGVTSIEEGAFWDTNMDSVVIPNNVTYIGNSAFENCPIKTLVIGTNVKEIEAHAFNAVSNDSKIYSLAITPPKISTMTFNRYWEPSFSNNHSARLYIPIGCKELYKNAVGWKLFSSHIYEIELDTTNQAGIQSSVKDTDTNMIMRYSINGYKCFMPINGINIIRMKDGTTKKVMMK